MDRAFAVRLPSVPGLRAVVGPGIDRDQWNGTCLMAEIERAPESRLGRQHGNPARHRLRTPERGGQTLCQSDLLELEL